MKTITATKLNNKWRVEVVTSPTYLILDGINIKRLCCLFGITNPKVIENKDKIIIQGE